MLVETEAFMIRSRDGVLQLGPGDAGIELEG
jgi:hypothetical protein